MMGCMTEATGTDIHIPHACCSPYRTTTASADSSISYVVTTTGTVATGDITPYYYHDTECRRQPEPPNKRGKRSFDHSKFSAKKQGNRK